VRALGTETAEIKADTLSVDHEKRTAHFEGNVRGTIGVLSVRCARLDITYNDVGEVVSLVAVGGVAVSHRTSTAVCRTARLDAEKGVLVLEGSPVLTRGPHRLEGRRITLHLKSGRLQVDDARGKFSLRKVDRK
jgi:lipopolysaccharide export system protein LptA